MKTIFQSILKEKRDYLFFLCIILNTSVVFSLRYFLTLDSGAHAYNSNILYNLLFGDKGAYNSFFSVNTELIPNMTAHLVMAVFNSFLPFNIAEKITLLIYFVSFPLLFRKLISKFNENKTYLIFLIFPFTHFCVLYFGFYNFAYGILFFLLGVIYWVSNRNNFRLKQIVIFFIIVTMSYFSHLFAFIALGMFCGIFELMDFLEQIRINSTFQIIKEKLKLFSRAIICFAAPLTFVVFYFKNRPSHGKESFLPFETLNDIILNGDIFTSYSNDDAKFSKPLFLFLAFLFLYTLVYKIENYISNKKATKLFQLSDVFLVFSLIFFYLFYKLPNSDGYGGYINIRLALYAHLILVIWICVTIKKDIKIEFVSLIVILFLNFKIFEAKKNSLSWLNAQFKNFEGVMEKIKDGDIIAPVFLSENSNWLGGHFSNYLGADKKAIVLDNYEASYGYFPVVWKNNEMPLLIAGKPKSREECLYFGSRLSHYPFGEVDYVFVYGNSEGDPMCQALINEIKKHYVLDYSSNDVFLYKKIVN